jgi:nitrogen regulatory protein PII
MKKLEIIIRPSKLIAVRKALETLGVHGMSINEIRGYGRQRGHKEVYRGTSLEAQFVPKVQINILVHDEAAQRVADVAVEAARTGEPGDGKIFILPVENAVRIRTGECGNDAL